MKCPQLPSERIAPPLPSPLQINYPIDAAIERKDAGKHGLGDGLGEEAGEIGQGHSSAERGPVQIRIFAEADRLQLDPSQDRIGAEPLGRDVPEDDLAARKRRINRTDLIRGADMQGSATDQRTQPGDLVFVHVKADIDLRQLVDPADPTLTQMVLV